MVDSLVKSGQTSEELIYQKSFGLKDDLSGHQNTPAVLEVDDSGDTNSSTSEKESNDSGEKSKFSNSARPKNEDAKINEKEKTVKRKSPQSIELVFVFPRMAIYYLTILHRLVCSLVMWTHTMDCCCM
ncbi:hypothetical protein QTP88_022019 [Uroleucon formosanum]